MPPSRMISSEKMIMSPLEGPKGLDNVDALSIGILPRVLLYLLQILGACFLAVVLTIRLKSGDFSSWKHIRQISLPRLSLVMSFIFAWLFCVVAGTLGYGIGLWESELVCAAGMYSSVAFYSASKFFVYVFLAERIHVVWDATLGQPRRRSPVYWLCMVLIAAYLGIVGYNLYVIRSALSHPADQRNADCYVSLPYSGVIAFMSLDAIITVALTCMFVCPLWKNTCINTNLRKTAIRSIIAVLITLPSSCANMIILLVHGSVEHGWEFMVCWEVDLLISATALFWVTSGNGLRPQSSIQHLRDSRHTEDSDKKLSSCSRIPSWVTGWPNVFSEAEYSAASLPDSATNVVPSPDIGVSEETPVDSVTVPSAAMTQRHASWPAINGIPSHEWQTPEVELPEFLNDKQQYPLLTSSLK
ncbi:hypothetical protein BC629DRAFT_756876 [Irpex lacteus]|nr:hypothetical protein BC629DRAFT_756876 [Irpex lacteus]